MSTEVTPINDAPYGTHGYRSDCRTSPFNQVMTIDHTSGQAGNNVAWFVQQSSTIFTYSASTDGKWFINCCDNGFGLYGNFAQYGFWTGYGAAAHQTAFQMGICDSYVTSSAEGLGVGFYFSCLALLLTVPSAP